MLRIYSDEGVLSGHNVTMLGTALSRSAGLAAEQPAGSGQAHLGKSLALAVY